MKFTLFLLLALSVSCNDKDSSTPAPVPESPSAPVVVTPVPEVPVITPDFPPTPEVPVETLPETPEPTPLPPEVIPTPELPVDPEPIPETPATPVHTWDANLTYTNFSATQKAKVEAAVELIKRVIETAEFKEAILNHTYNGVKTFVDNGGYTNAEIYEIIMDGAEKLKPVKNGEMDADLILYYTNNSTIGYTYSNVSKIWMNTKYFNSYTPAEVSSNLIHEWMHKLGFGHSTSYTTYRKYSVPYAVGNLMGSMTKGLDN